MPTRLTRETNINLDYELTEFRPTVRLWQKIKEAVYAL